MAADVLSQSGLKVDVFDAMPSMGRKFLMAGKGGMNISHSEILPQFLKRYGSSQADIAPILQQFGPASLLSWLQELGITTFIGSSGRIFPTDMKAAPLLRAWLHRLRMRGVKLHVRHHWLGFAGHDDLALEFSTPTGRQRINTDAVILALGGGSWPQLGSTGAWPPVLRQRGVTIAPLKPSNCGFETLWTEHFKSRYAGHPVKPVKIQLSAESDGQQGELIITEHGLEGGLLYALSAPLRAMLENTGQATIHLDLTPNLSAQQLRQRLSAPKAKQSLANHLRKTAGIDGVKAGLLHEVLTPADFQDIERLCSTIKALPITLTGIRPLAEAISSAGGVSFSALTEQLMLTAMPGCFCAGEMLDWEAPTGGYLLTACFASGHVAGNGVLQWLQPRKD